MTEKYFLQPHVYACSTDDGAIFLDLKTRAYLGVGLTEASVLDTFVEGWPRQASDSPQASVTSADAQEILDTLQARGLLTRSATVGKHAEQLSSRCTGAIPFQGYLDKRPVVRARDIGRFVLACARTSLRLRLLSFERVVLGAQARKRKNPRATEPVPARDVQELIAVFRRLTPFLFTKADACLFDSLALTDFLSLYGVFPTWIIAVRTRPFGAHSWVQYQGTALNESVDVTYTFQPLLMV